MASHTGSLYKRGRVWWCSFYDHVGRHHCLSTKTRDRKEAEKFLRAKLAKLDRGQAVSAPARLTVKHLLDALEEDYRVKGRHSLKRVKGARKHLEKFFTSSRKALTITGRDLRQYLLYRTEQEDVATATVRYELAVLRKAFAIAQADEVLDRIPVFPKFERTPSRDVYVPDGDHRAIVARLDDPVSHLVNFLYWTGWRVGARGDEGALNLTWDQVDWTTGSLLVGDGSKTKKPGRFFFSEVPEVEALLRELRARNEKWVFAHEDGRHLGYKFALKAFKAAQEAAGVVGPDGDPYCFHDYRRSVARRLEQGGVPRSTARKITGHKTERIYAQYAVGEDEDVRRALATVLATVATEGQEAKS